MAAKSAAENAATAQSNGKTDARSAKNKPNGKAGKRAVAHMTASLYCSRRALPPKFVKAAGDLERAVERPVWLCVQQGDDDEAVLGAGTLHHFLSARRELAADGPVALVIESAGGYAREAFNIARVLCRNADGFMAVIPRYAKSAATLMALGADSIVMGTDAEVGPLDAQLWDQEREERSSALDEIQALERLHTAGLEQLDQTMALLMAGAQKRTEILLPIACKFVSDTMAPLLEKIDTVHYAKQSRVLKVAEDYAVRLLEPTHGQRAARHIADRLVNGYSEHGFVIDRQEMGALMGRHLAPKDHVKDAVQRLDECLLEDAPLVAIGRLKEVEA